MLGQNDGHPRPSAAGALEGNGPAAEPAAEQPTGAETPMEVEVTTSGTPMPQTHQFRDVLEAGEGRKRLVMRKMVLINFKSYAGRQTVGPFDPSFTAVVGPNGSGKSNVIDALLFVFGFRAKKMRQDKLGQLIHRSQGHTGLTSCTVEVHFEVVEEGDGGATTVPGSGLVVSRTAYANHTSRYHVNGSPSHFGQVTALLREHGVDLDHNRFLILQGEVELIAHMKPKATAEGESGLLEYLEDIIGTARYKQPLEEAQASVEALNEARGAELERLRIVERDHEAARTRAAGVEAAIAEMNDLVRKKNALWQGFLTDANRNVDALGAVVAETLTSQTALAAQHAEADAKMPELASAAAAAAHEAERLEAAAQQQQQRLEAMATADAAMQERRKNLKARQKRLARTAETSGAAVAELQAWLSGVDARGSQRSNDLGAARTTLQVATTALDAQRAALRAQTAGLQAELQAARAAARPVVEARDARRDEIRVAEAERGVLAEQAAARGAAVHKRAGALRQSQQALSALHHEARQADVRVTAAADELKKLAETLEAGAAREAALRAELDAAQSELAAAAAAEEAVRSRTGVLAALLRHQAQGAIPGLLGRLGDLGAIDARYDVAVTTACSQLDDLVVDTVETAQTCLDFLRERQIGRARFICLDKLRPAPKTTPATPEGAARLYDLVQPREARLRAAFYFALQETLVADDMAQAKRLAYGATRFRVVTLQGQLIDRAGTMSGGGTRAQSGGMRLTSEAAAAGSGAPVTAAQLEAMRQRADGLEREWSRLQSQRVLQERQLEKTRAEQTRLETVRRKLRVDVERVEREVADATAALAQAETVPGLDPAQSARAAKLDDALIVLRAALLAAEGPAAESEAAVERVEAQIEAAGGDALQAAVAAHEDATRAVATLEQAASQALVEMRSKERERATLTETAQKAREEADAAAAELAAVKDQMEKQLAEAVELRLGAEDAERARSAAAEASAAAAAALRAGEESAAALVDEARALAERLADRQRELGAESKKAAHWQSQLASLALVETGFEETPVVPLEQLSADELAAVDRDELAGAIALLEAHVARAAPDLAVLREYRQRHADLVSRAQRVDAVTADRDAAKTRYSQLRERRLDEFMAGFRLVSDKLKHMYQLITMGGNAELELADSLDPFSEGINFSVMPPKKSWKNISNLSGGEKTLSSLALLFALHHFKPTPLYVMDEIDAALDFRNVSIVASYLKERTRDAQFLIISLRNNMFEQADRLVGIYKTVNCTKSVAINPQSVARVALERVAAAALAARGRSSGGVGASGRNVTGEDSGDQDEPRAVAMC